MVARPIGLHKAASSSTGLAPTTTATAAAPTYRVLHVLRNGSGEYVQSTHYMYSDAWCMRPTGGDAMSLRSGAVPASRRPIFRLSSPSGQILCGRLCSRGRLRAALQLPNRLGARRLERQRQQLHCRRWCLLPHASRHGGRRRIVATTVRHPPAFSNDSGAFIHHTAFSDAACSMPVGSEVISSGLCLGGSSGDGKPQSWLGVADQDNAATTATFFCRCAL